MLQQQSFMMYISVFTAAFFLIVHAAVSREEIHIVDLSLPEGAQSLELVWIEPGSFQMGSENGKAHEKPVHSVKITQGYYLGKFEITQAQMQTVTKSDISFFTGNNKPAENVSWEASQLFIQNLNDLTEGYNFRLPTEAEWEYACRAGTTTEFYWGEDEAEKYAWTKETDAKGTNDVGQKQPNAWGLYDMAGNVWEWCSDFYSPNYFASSPEVDPTGPETGLFRVARGGGWNDSLLECRSSSRTAGGPTDTGGSLGFRVAADKET